MEHSKGAIGYFFSYKVIVQGNMFHPRVINQIGTQVGGTCIVAIKSWRMIRGNTKFMEKILYPGDFSGCIGESLVFCLRRGPGYRLLFGRSPRDNVPSKI